MAGIVARRCVNRKLEVLEAMSREVAFYLLTQAGIFLALSFPGFFLSTRFGFLVTQPARKR